MPHGRRLVSSASRYDDSIGRIWLVQSPAGSSSSSFFKTSARAERREGGKLVEYSESVEISGFLSGDKDRGGVLAPETLLPPTWSRCRRMLRLLRRKRAHVEPMKKAAPSSRRRLNAIGNLSRLAFFFFPSFGPFAESVLFCSEC